MTVREQFTRTTCGCQLCQIGCRTKPGYLAVGDLELILAKQQPADPELYVLENFVAGQGALVGQRMPDGSMRKFHVPSITPAQRADGKCVFLSTDGKCSIHAVSPFGCAYFDTHMPDEDANVISTVALNEILQDHQTQGLYHQRWKQLDQAGKRSPLAVVVRAVAYDAELRRLRQLAKSRKLPKRMFKKP